MCDHAVRLPMFGMLIVLLNYSTVSSIKFSTSICKSSVSIGGGTGGRMGLGPPVFCLNIISLSNTVSIGSSDKVNRL